MIKKIFVILFLFFFQHSISAQSVIHKDSYNLSGGISFSISNNNHPAFDSKTTSLIFNPSVAYHLLDVFTIGGNILYKYSDEKVESDSDNERSIERVFELGPTVRYYFHSNNFAPFVDCSFNYSIVLPAETEGYGLAIGIGINYFFTKSIAIEPKVSYVMSKYSKPDYDSKTFQIGIGLNYHINE